MVNKDVQRISHDLNCLNFGINLLVINSDTVHILPCVNHRMRRRWKTNMPTLF